MSVTISNLIEILKSLFKRLLGQRNKTMQTEDENVELPECAAQRANCLSKLVFWYSLKIFKIGIRRDLEESDLSKPLDAHKSDLLGTKIAKFWVKEYDKAMHEKRQPSMMKVIFQTFWKDMFIYGIILLIMEMLIRLTQPLFIGLFIKYFGEANKSNQKPFAYPTYLMRLFYFWSPDQSRIQETEAYVYASGVFICSIIIVMTMHPYLLAALHIGMQVRVACCSLIYRKALRIQLAAMGGKTVGNTINLMSNDVNRFDTAPIYLHYLYISPLQTGFITYFLYEEMGLPGLIGVLAVLAVVPLQVFLGFRTAVLRRRAGDRTDDRVMQMNEVIQSMQVIKMYAWEGAFAKLISKLRKRELRVLLQTSWIRGVLMSFVMFTTRGAIFLTILCYVLFGEHITAEKIFVVSAYYQILRTTMTVYFPQGIAMLAEATVSVSRIQAFMLTKETIIGDPSPLDAEWMLKPKKYAHERNRSVNDSFLKVDGPFVKIVHGIAKYGDTVCLDNINLEAYPRLLTAIVGPVGSGKTCILNVILGELSLFSGKIKTSGPISYAAQEAWLFAGSVRQNIIFGREFEYARYKEVVKVCALVKDFTLLPYGDRTIVGEKGISLSGGQRARVNLARAVYKRAEIYLLDDPLSAVDINVGRQLFENCIGGYLKTKIVILITHQLQYLKRADRIILMDEGEIRKIGTYSELLEGTGSFTALLQDVEAAAAVVTEEKETDRFVRGISVTTMRFNSIIDIEGKKTRPRLIPEMRTFGAVDFVNYKEYFLAGSNCCGIIIMILLFLGAQGLASGGDYFLAKWVSLEELRYHLGSAASMGFWNELSRENCITVYSVIMGATILVALIRSFTFFAICMRASMKLHNKMFHSVINAHMRFFNQNTSGRILNRFSKDLGCLDELLPNAFIDTTQLLLNLVGAVVVVVCIEPYLMIIVAVVGILFYFLRRIYLATSRNVKRLEGITRSPVFAHLNATIQGLTTIRSNGAEQILVKEFDKLQDIHSSAWFMFLYTSRAFGFCVDIICAIFIGVVTFSFIVLAESYHGSVVGLGITQCIGLTGLVQWGMRQSAELENQMTSVERVLEFTRIEQESDLVSAPEDKPPSTWPKTGRIEFVNLYMRYSLFEHPVLRGLNFIVYPLEKVGIVGRTGAGKSSLIVALFRLAYFEGQILIDNLDIGVLGLHDLRKKISIIPQEPVLFSGTLRYNLDPFNEYDDQAIFNALMDVELKNAVQGGIKCLDDVMTEGGSNLSVGQRQMVCLARAILRNNIILIMDEATANVDAQTDKFIQTTIRNKFAHCTVLTIAHRLHTIMDADRVLVMDAGVAVEFDVPHLLLQNKDSVFKDMVQKTGHGTAKVLENIAKKYYMERFPTGRSPKKDNSKST